MRLLSRTTSVARITSAGSLDTDFYTNGYVTRTLPNGACGASVAGYASAIALRGDGKVVVAGQTTSSDPASNSMFAMRFLHENDGQGHIVDSGFNSGSRDGAMNRTLRASFAVSRLTDSGALDSTFDADGKLSTTFTGASIEGINATAITPDGKFLAAGQAMSSSCCGTSDFGLSRYNVWDSRERIRYTAT